MRHLIDKKRARRAFERAASTYDAAAVLQREVGRRLMARLEYMKLAPKLIVDAGAGTALHTGALARRYPEAQVVALDIAHDMLKRASPAGVYRICADIEQLPLASKSTAIIFSNLVLQWINAPKNVFREAQRVLEANGLFLFSSFGPDTLQELREAWADRHTHVSSFYDMHDLGDMLIANGFDDPVMECERLTMTYSQVTDLMRDLKAIGASNATAGRPPGLTGKAALERVKRNYERLRADGKLPATFEVIYAHAWKREVRVSSSGRPIIEIVPDRS
jgi:malonyl-CoA O-methyltransferase